MPSKKSYPNNILPLTLQDLNSKELFLFTGISTYLLDGFIEGRFKPNVRDREILSNLSRLFYRYPQDLKRGYVERRKLRALRSFLTLSEKEHLFNQQKAHSYNHVLNELIDKYWNEIVASKVEKRL